MAMNGSNQQAQVVYCSHEGGPLPLLGDPGHQAMIDFMRQLPFQLRRPEAIVVISAHWEEPMATLMGASKPSMLYDYYGFPREAYQITYPAPGAPAGVGSPVLGHRFGGRGPLCPSQQLGGWPGGAAQIRGPLSGRGEDPAATDPRSVARHGHPYAARPDRGSSGPHDQRGGGSAGLAVAGHRGGLPPAGRGRGDRTRAGGRGSTADQHHPAARPFSGSRASMTRWPRPGCHSM